MLLKSLLIFIIDINALIIRTNLQNNVTIKITIFFMDHFILYKQAQGIQ